MRSGNAVRWVSIVLVVALVTTPVSAVVGAGEPEPHSRTAGTMQFGGAQFEDRCGVVENLTVSDVVLSLGIENGTVENLELDGEETNATVRNGSILFDQVQLSIDRAALNDESINLTSETVSVVGGSFFLQNASTTVDGEVISLENRRLTVEDNAASDAGIAVAGVNRIQRAPATFLDNSSMDSLTLSDLSDDLRFESASRSVLGVAVLRMENVELSANPLRPTFEAVTIRNSEITANSISVPVDDGDISIGELAISSEGVTFRNTDVSADIEDETVELDDVTVEEAQLTDLFEDAC